MKKTDIIKDYFEKDFILFVMCSAFAAGVNFVSRIFISFAASYELAIVLAYCIGIAVAFAFNKLFVFDSKNGSVIGQLGRFIIVNLFAMIQVLLLSMLFKYIVFPAVGFTLYPSETAHFIGLASTAFTSFLGHKYFTFALPRNRQVRLTAANTRHMR